MDSDSVKILLLADTHLGFDLPFKPRVKRRRRGYDFFNNFNLALEPARRGEVDLVVHGGDLFYRSKVPDALVQMAMQPLTRVAASGVPVFLVPGNHERSRIPRSLWSVHQNLHIFDEPCTFMQEVRGTRVALSGFPFERQARQHFKTRLEETGFDKADASLRLLCIHQAVEGAQVGPVDFTFRHGKDVVRGADIPPDFAGVLCGHIHRSQVLTHDLQGRKMGAPVISPGSIERTSFAERFEDKHYAIIHAASSRDGSGVIEKMSFIQLPARPMVKLVIDGPYQDVAGLAKALAGELSGLDEHAVVQVAFGDRVPLALASQLSAPTLRRIAPPTMNISLALRRWEG
jgi:DNA repair exonuclease SbcCD nuclease subunit